MKELLLRTKIANARTTSVTNDDASETSSIAPMHSSDSGTFEAQIVSLATAFLVIHPQGAEIESILSYVRKFAAAVDEGELLDVLNKNEKLFTVVAVDSEQLWFYSGFKATP